MAVSLTWGSVEEKYGAPLKGIQGPSKAPDPSTSHAAVPAASGSWP